ncbi:hypothetical protein JL720_4828 [Aureococcus anophagefferens]|nr:hypothetical protein JL720_4828 [Aureococcus anophagefferens]
MTKVVNPRIKRATVPRDDTEAWDYVVYDVVVVPPTTQAIKVRDKAVVVGGARLAAPASASSPSAAVAAAARSKTARRRVVRCARLGALARAAAYAWGADVFCEAAAGSPDRSASSGDAPRVAPRSVTVGEPRHLWNVDEVAVATLGAPATLARRAGDGGSFTVLALVAPRRASSRPARGARRARAQRDGPRHTVEVEAVVVEAAVEEAAVAEAGGEAAVATPAELRAMVLACYGDVAEADLINDDATFETLGVDSLASVELRNAIAKKTGVEVDNAVILSNPTLQAVVDAVGPEMEFKINLNTTLLIPVAQRLPRPVAFICSTPRAGSSLTQLCLNAHSMVFAPQELYLLQYRSIGDRYDLLSTNYAMLLNGLDETMAVARVLARRGAAYVDALRAADEDCLETYRRLGDFCSPRLFVDKTPPNSLHRHFLDRADAMCLRGRFVALVRHPQPTIESWAGLVTRMNEALGFSEKLPPNHHEFDWCYYQNNAIRATYEELVTQPGGLMKRVCTLLDLAYEPQMATPYQTDAVKMFAPDGDSGDKKIAATDDKLMKNKAIEPKLADRWRKSIITLKPSTKKLAWSLGYSVLEHGAVLPPPPKRAPETLSNAVADAAVYVICTPRSGSSLLQLCLESHPLLYAPQELYLLKYDDLQHRADNTPEKSGLYGGLLETVATLRQETSDHGRAWVKHGEARCLDTRVVYASLTEWTKPRLFVDKTPGYSRLEWVLNRTHFYFAKAKMLAIVRHPHACVESWRELWQKNNRLQNKDADVPWATVEASYVEQNENIRRFLRTVPKDRRLLVTYEGLVTDPPGDAERRASKGGVASTDPKLLKHKGIDPKLADKWRRVAPPPPGLSLATKRLGWELGYSFVHKRAFRVIDTSVQAGLASTLARGEDGAPAVVVLYDGLGFKYGSGLRVPAGHALVACQAPELADPTLPAPAGVEARARDAALLADVLGPRPHVVLVGYSFGGVVALPLRGALRDAHAIPTKALLLVDPMPFGSAPGDVASADGPLLRARATTRSSSSSTRRGARSHLPSRDAFDELTRVAHFLDTCDMAFDWQRAAPLGDVPVHFFKTAGGPAHFARRKRANCAHRDGVYGWTALEPAFRAPTVVLDGGHFEAFRGAEKLEALAAAVAAHAPAPAPGAAAPVFAAATSSGAAMLFPGQGAQKVGMLAPYKATPGVVEMFEHGSRIFGIDLLKLVEEGPAEKLDDTRYSQVCVFLTSMAAVKTLERDDPDAVARCSVTAGFSLGEYSALTFAGVMDLDTALTLLKLRGEAMGAACDLAPSGMMTVIGLEDDQLEALMAGTDAAVKALKNPPKGLKTIVQPVSGAFHSPFMATAAEKLGEALAAATFRKPARVVYSNVDGRPHADDADAIKRRMKAQLTAGVMWQDTIDHIGDLDAFYEPAPGKQLASMMRRIDAARHAKMRSI